eukprot:9117326-Prorocentrum_lima.AAC.1
MLEQTNEEHNYLDNLPPDAPDLRNRKQRNQIQYHRLLPGSCCGVHTLLVQGRLITDENEVSRHLSEYWA